VTKNGGATYKTVMRNVFAGIVILAAVMALAARPPATVAASPRAPAFLVTLAARTAAGNCDKHPTRARYVRTTRQASEALFGERVDSDQRVYLVLLRGKFVAVYARGVYRARDEFPRGTVITFTVDAETHDILDFGIGRGAPRLAWLGRVHDFTAELRAAPKRASPPLCSG